MSILISGAVAVLCAVGIGKVTRYWIYNGSHSIIGSIVLVACMYFALIYGSFGTLMNIVMGCLLTVGVGALLGAIGRSYDKYAINTHLTIGLLIFAGTFLIK